MNVRSAALSAVAVAGAAGVGYLMGHDEPSPDKPWIRDDGITGRELPPALGFAFFGGAFGAIGGAGGKMLVHINDVHSPKIVAATVVGALMGVALTATMGFTDAAENTYDYEH